MRAPARLPSSRRRHCSEHCPAFDLVKTLRRGAKNTMRVKGMTAKRSMIWARAVQRALRKAARGVGVATRPSLAALLAILLAGGPVWAQDQQPTQKPAPAPEKPGLPAPAQGAYTPTPTNPPIPVSLGVSKYSYTR